MEKRLTRKAVARWERRDDLRYVAACETPPIESVEHDTHGDLCHCFAAAFRSPFTQETSTSYNNRGISLLLGVASFAPRFHSQPCDLPSQARRSSSSETRTPKTSLRVVADKRTLNDKDASECRKPCRDSRLAHSFRNCYPRPSLSIFVAARLLEAFVSSATEQVSDGLTRVLHASGVFLLIHSREHRLCSRLCDA